MTRRASAAAIVAGMIVRAGKRQDGVEQSRFLQAEENRIGAQLSAEAAVAELVVRFAGIFLSIGIANLRLFATAAFEQAKDVAGLRSFPAKERIEFGNHAFRASLLEGRLWRCLDRLRQAVAIVAFPEARVLDGIAAVVVERRTPQHSRVRHHARGNSARLRRVTASRSPSFWSDAQVALVHT